MVARAAKKRRPKELDVPLPPDNLPEEDGEPLETNWHRLAMNLLIEILSYRWRDRDDFFVGGNMFIYYSTRQVRRMRYRGPDFFVVLGVPRQRERRYWAVWDEDGRYPNMIMELLSPKTAKADRTTKKEIYERTFRTPEYFLYDPAKKHLEGWRLANGSYIEIQPDQRGWLWSEQLKAWVGLWDGQYLGVQGTYPRLFDASGKLLPIRGEAEEHRAEVAEKRAGAAEQLAGAAEERAGAAEGEVQRLRRELESLRHTKPKKSNG
jgi:Uma2 family endonuclease